MHTPSESLPQQLLAEASWVRRLARTLVGDPNVADDVAQETLMAALEGAPRGHGSRRRWLVRVLHNRVRRVWRGEVRRRDRERWSARGDCPPSPDELAQRAEGHRRVTAAVLALEEPYRTVLLLRYLEEHTPTEIAALLGIPLSTVKTRLSRGLAQLRVEFGREDGGGRGWLAALAGLPSFARTSGSAPVLGATVGGLAMATKVKWIALSVGALFALAAVGTFLPAGDVLLPGQGAGGQDSATDLEGSRAASAERREAGEARLEEASSTLAPGAQAASAAERSVLSGIVVDSQGRAVVAAEIEAWFDPSETFFVPNPSTPPTPSGTTRSATDGRFELELTPARPYSLKVSAVDFAAAHLDERYAGETVRITLLPPARVRGFVVSEPDGAPARGGHVRLFEEQGHVEIEVDERGAFTIQELRPGPFALLALPRHEAVGRYTTFEVGAGETLDVELRVQAGLVVEGNVTAAATGELLPDVEVSSGGFLHKITRTNAVGRYRLEGVEATRPVTIVARAPGYARSGVTLDPDQSALLDIELVRAREVAGSIVDPGGEPIAGASVLAWPEESGAFFTQGDRRCACTGIDGGFHLKDLHPDGELVLVARAPGHGTRMVPLPASSDPAEHLLEVGEIVLGPAASLEGRLITPEGQGVAAWMDLRPVDQASFGAMRSFRAARDGRFAVGDLAPGDYTLRAATADRPVLEGIAVSLAAGEQRTGFELRLPGGLAIEGFVVDHARVPVPDVQVGASRQVEDGSFQSSSRGRTDEAGWFRIEGLAPGLYRIGGGLHQPWEHHGEPLRLARFQVSDVEPGGAPLEIVLRPIDQVITGRVVDATGAPVPLAYVWVEVGLPSPTDGVLADEQGRFELPVPGGEPLEIVARRTSHLSEASGNLYAAELAAGRHITATDEGEARSSGVEPGARGIELRLKH